MMSNEVRTISDSATDPTGGTDRNAVMQQPFARIPHPSSLALLHYRPWRGQFYGPAWSAWPIARIALVMIFRRKIFWVLYALALTMFLLFFFGQYMLAWAET